MLWTRDSDKPPLSAILPRLYLGAESDVTQDCLSSLGISYVLSVSRCSPQPSFLPRSRYLRIPIDDSLWDDLLPWIPEALSFIDGAMSSGASVLVHCAAGISRSPALAVAYIMYRLGLDLDQAYRFVKERRPSISPNFNFLGQLQLFQSTLCLSSPAGGVARHHQESCDRQSDSAHHNQGAELPIASETTERTVQRCQDGHLPEITPPSKLSTLQLPESSASLQEKRRSLTLSLTPLRVEPAGGAATTPSEPKDMSLKDRGPAHRKEQGPAHRKEQGPIHREQGPIHREQGPTIRKEQGAGSPFTLGLNKLLDWGERLLLGGLFVAPVKMGQPALPYRC